MAAVASARIVGVAHGTTDPINLKRIEARSLQRCYFLCSTWERNMGLK